MIDYQLPIFASYFLFFAMIFYWISLSIFKKNVIFFCGRILVFLSNLCFTVSLLNRWITENYFPLSNLYESLLFLCWSISTIHLILEYKTRSRLIGSILTPILFFISSFASLTLPVEMQKALPLVPSLQSNWLMMHVSMMMISYATLISGSLLAILYLAFLSFNKKPGEKISFENIEMGRKKTEKRTETRILNKNSENLLLVKNSKLSLLESIDIWSYRIIALGFPFLTIGITSGAVWANEAWGSYWSWDPKETWAFITWLVFASYLHSRLLKGWQGKNAALLGSCGFLVIWICYLGVNFLGKGLHSYGWILN
jgi:cytochrome c-type biogenesis protein CcsB